MNNHKFVISGSTGWLGIEALRQLEKFGVSKNNLFLLSSKQALVETRKQIYETNTSINISLNFTGCCYYDFAFLTKEKFSLLGENNYTKENINLINNSVNLIQKIRPRSVLLTSSGAVYGNIRKKNKDQQVYASLKLFQEEKLREVCDEVGANLVVVRIFNISGRGIYKLNTFALSEFILKALKNEKIEINSSIPILRRYCDISQLIKLCILMVEQNLELNFDSGGIKIDLVSLAKYVVRILNSKSIVFSPQIIDNGQIEDYSSQSDLYEKYVGEILLEKPRDLKDQILRTAKYISKDLNGMI